MAAILGMLQALPPSVANASKEDLQRMLMDSLRKTKARDKRIADLTAEKEALQSAAATPKAEPESLENGAATEHLEEQLKVILSSTTFLMPPEEAIKHLLLCGGLEIDCRTLSAQ